MGQVLDSKIVKDIIKGDALERNFQQEKEQDGVHKSQMQLKSINQNVDKLISLLKKKDPR